MAIYIFKYTGHISMSRVSFADEKTTPTNNAALHKLLDLVDKYWNGSKSLHDNKKFMSK